MHTVVTIPGVEEKALYRDGVLLRPANPCEIELWDRLKKASETLQEIPHIGVLLNQFAMQVHNANQKWWVNPATGERKLRNVGEMLCLVHSEISEALEGHRNNLMDDKLPHRTMLEVELADAVIRIFDIAAGLGLDIGGAYVEKMAYNAVREDHKLEARNKPGGKAY